MAKKKLPDNTIPVFCAHDAIVQTEKVIGNPKNPNVHPNAQIELLAKIIKAQGWRSPITVSNRSGFVVKGHGRLAAAQLLNEQNVPVDYQDYENEAAEYADMIADNKIAELAFRDDDKLKELIIELQEMKLEDIELTGYTQSEIDFMLEEYEQEDLGEVDFNLKEERDIFGVTFCFPKKYEQAKAYINDNKESYIEMIIADLREHGEITDEMDEEPELEEAVS